MDQTLEDIIKSCTNKNAINILAANVMKEVETNPYTTHFIDGKKMSGINLKDYFAPVLAFNPKVFQYIKEKLTKESKSINNNIYETDNGIYALISNKRENEFFNDNYVLKKVEQVKEGPFLY